MNEFRDTAAKDDSLAHELLPPILIGTALLGLTLLLLVMIIWKSDGWGWIYPTTLLVAAHSANQVRQRGREKSANWLLCGAYGLLPVLTISSFGAANNSVVYLAALGV